MPALIFDCDGVLADTERDGHRGDGARGPSAARPGIPRIVDQALRAGWTLAVASTSAEESVRAVLEHAVGADNAAQFAMFAGDVVPAKKPDPAIHNLAIERLGIRPGTRSSSRTRATACSRRSGRVFGAW